MNTTSLNPALWSPSKACCDFSAQLRYEDIPAAAVDSAKKLLLDWLGCALAGAATAEADHIRQYTREQGGSAHADILGEPQGYSAAQAAMCNGYYGHILEMDDVDRESISHPATVNIPAALAVGQKLHRSGSDMLAAFITGYEVMLRIGAAITPAHYEIWHTTATAGVFGSAMTAGRLLGLNAEKLAWALGNAGTMSAGLWQFLPDGAMSKYLHTGAAASNGVLVASLAAGGFTGAAHILEGKQGFFAGYARQDVDETLFRDFGKHYRIVEVSFKPYPSCRHTHSAVDAALSIREQAGGVALRRVTVNSYSTAVRIAGQLPRPTDMRGAKFSLHYCVAATLLHGVPDESVFSPQAIADPVLGDFLRKVTVQASPELDKSLPLAWPCRIEAETVEGRKLEAVVMSPKGDPGNPLDWDGVKGKFSRVVDGHIAPTLRDQLIALCEHAENLEDCGEILRTANTGFQVK